MVDTVPACRLDELRDGVAISRKLGGRNVLVVRVGDDIYALEDRCPHKDARLSEGRVHCNRLEIICPWHLFRFDLRTGISITNPKDRTPTFPVRVDAGQVLVAINAA